MCLFVKRKKIKARLFTLQFLGMLLIVLFFLGIFLFQYRSYLALVKEEKKVINKYEEAKKLEVQYQNDKLLNNSDIKIEERARKELNMLKQNEIKVIINEN